MFRIHQKLTFYRMCKSDFVYIFACRLVCVFGCVPVNKNKLIPTLSVDTRRTVRFTGCAAALRDEESIAIRILLHRCFLVSNFQIF